MSLHPTFIRGATCAALALCVAVPAAAQPTLPVEVFAGRMDFGSRTGLRDQELAGVRLGLDLRDYAGISGFYWRGVDRENSKAAPMQAFGAEAQLNLNSGRGLTPFLVGGVGRIDILEGYADSAAAMPEDQNALIAGAGARLDLGRVGLVGAVRSYLFELRDEDSEDLRSNLLWSAGLSFRLGSSGRRAAVAAAPTIIRQTPDTVYVARDGARGEASRDDSERFITIPIPKEGEIYLRYGPADSSGVSRRPAVNGPPMTDAQVNDIRRQVLADLEPVLRGLMAEQREQMRDLIRDEVARVGAAGLSPGEEARMLELVEARLALRLRDEIARAGGQPGVPSAREREGSGFDPRPRAWWPYVGGNLDRPRQFVLGIRTDLGPLSAARPALRLVPEAAIGFGEATNSVMIAGHFQYDVNTIDLSGTSIIPYGYAGPGFLFMGDPPRGRARTEAVLNFGYGIVVPVPNRGPRPRLFIEHQGVDLFDLNRLIIGLRL
jgi:hypothetical protein